MDNSSAMAAGGAGISTAQVIADKGVQAVLTENCGPNTYQVLSSSGDSGDNRGIHEDKERRRRLPASSRRARSPMCPTTLAWATCLVWEVALA